MPFINIIIALLYKYYCNNIILDFKRVSYNNMIIIKNIDDYINYDIYTELLVGTPPQKVTYFIEPNDSAFQFKKLSLYYNKNKFNNSYINQIQKEYFHSFNSSKSSSYKGYFSENFTFNKNYNENINIPDLKITIYMHNRDEKEKYGSLGLFTMPKAGFLLNDLFSLINQLKTRKIIDDYIFTVLYNDSNEFYTGFTKLGIIIIEEYLYEFNNTFYNKDNEISIYSSSSTCWALIIDEIKFSYNNFEIH